MTALVGADDVVAPAREHLAIDNVSLRFGGIVALDGLSFTVAPGTICGLIGPNGAGKTSAFNVISRAYRPQSGSVRLGNTELLKLPAHAVASTGIARTFQNLALFPTLSVLDNVMIGAHCTGRVGFLRALSRLGVARENRATAAAAARLLDRLGLSDVIHDNVSALPFGSLKRLEIARALASRPRVLLLDEPAAGLTHSEVTELGHTITTIRDDFKLTVLLVEHHMTLVMSISDAVVAMDFGRKIADGSPADVRNNQAVIDAYLGVEQ